jgi:hypothetical protein
VLGCIMARSSVAGIRSMFGRLESSRSLCVNAAHVLSPHPTTRPSVQICRHAHLVFYKLISRHGSLGLARRAGCHRLREGWARGAVIGNGDAQHGCLHALVLSVGYHQQLRRDSDRTSAILRIFHAIRRLVSDASPNS